MSAGHAPIEEVSYYQLTQTRAARLWEKEGRKCHWCKCLTVLTKHQIPNQATEDHVHPRGKGGSNEEDNVVSACANCNRRRNKEATANMSEGKLLPKKELYGTYVQSSAQELKIEQLERSLALAKSQYETLKTSNEESKKKYTAAMDYLAELTFWGLAKQKFKRWASRKDF